MTKPFLTAAAVLAALTIAPAAVAQSVSGSGSVKTTTGEKTMPEQSNKGGALRGLDRANDVAGEHGAQGRANAAAKQGITTGSGGTSADVKAKAKLKGGID